jgi:UDP-GlcNAc:undecaprenyl-phosphate GlcNAc-1-phosphate transferase
LRRHISPFQGGQDHLSHRLIRVGLSRKQAAITLWGLTAIFALFVILINQPTLSIQNYIVITAGVFWVLLFVLFFRTKDF